MRDACNCITRLSAAHRHKAAPAAGAGGLAAIARSMIFAQGTASERSGISGMIGRMRLLKFQWLRPVRAYTVQFPVLSPRSPAAEDSRPDGPADNHV